MKLFAQGVKIPDPGIIKGLKPEFTTLGAIVSEALKYVLVIGGLSMFAMIIFGGFTLLISSGEAAKVKEATDRIVFSIVGFLIIFASYWIVQIVEIIFGLQIL